MLDLSRLVNLLLDLDWILIDLCSQLSCNLDLLMSLLNIILNNQEHRFVA